MMEKQGGHPIQKDQATRKDITDGGNHNPAANGFEHIPVGTIGINSAGIIRYINSAARSEFNFDPGSL
ncbi:MAG TPA: hypothetical protein VHS53_15385, partial [Mucilaginibacter sp.]|nr:hypothetical protein [Mucilaginibacter sp.]